MGREAEVMAPLRFGRVAREAERSPPVGGRFVVDMTVESPSSAGDPARPLRRDAERNRERLLDAARELLTERGLDVTMDEIAHHAGLGVGTAYRRFASREALVDALIEERLADFIALAEEVAQDPDPWRGLTTFVERSTAMQVADRGLKDLLIGHAHRLERVAAVRARVLAVLGEIVPRAHASGRLRADVDTHDIGMITLMLSAAAEFSADVRPDLWRRYLVMLVDGLRADCPAPTPLPGGPLEPDELERALAAQGPRRR